MPGPFWKEIMIAQDVEQTILDRPLPQPLPADEGWVVPHYDGLSIANLPATIANLLTGEGTGTPTSEALPGALPPLPGGLTQGWGAGLERIVLIILDALGWRLLQHMWDAGEGQAFARLAAGGVSAPLTSVFPSTTDAALVSLRTGRSPAEHGWLAYEMYLRELGMAANAIRFRPVWGGRGDSLVDWGLDPDTLIPVPSLAEQLAARGIETHALYARYFRGSGFSQMLYRGVTETHTHLHAADFWTQLRGVLAGTRGRRVLVTAYWSGLDTLAHAYGPDSEAWEATFRTVDFLLGREFLDVLAPGDRAGTLLVVTADHGQIRVPPEGIATAAADEVLRRHLMVPLVGESRAAFLYPRPGRAAAVREHLASAYPGWFVVADSSALLEGGLMGHPVSDETRCRAGELLVLPRGNHALQRAEPKVSLLGRHGGLTADEMLVPLLATRLDTLS
jgi:hypothetical protein